MRRSLAALGMLLLAACQDDVARMPSAEGACGLEGVVEGEWMAAVRADTLFLVHPDWKQLLGHRQVITGLLWQERTAEGWRPIPDAGWIGSTSCGEERWIAWSTTLSADADSVRVSAAGSTTTLPFPPDPWRAPLPNPKPGWEEERRRQNNLGEVVFSPMPVR